jgi:hypothetical protein
MVLTRQQRIEARDPVVSVVMGLGDDSDLKKALEKHSVSNIQALLSIHDVDIDALDFQDALGNVVPLA